MKRRRHAFTLLELVLAMMLASMVVLALYKVMTIAFNARKTALRTVAPARQLSIAADLIGQDFESIVPPASTSGDTAPVNPMAGAFEGEHQSGGSGDADQVEFYTIGAESNNDDPLNEGIRRIDLLVRTDETPPVLVRQVTRNLLNPSPTGDPDEEEVLCRNVKSFTVQYFDGTTWQTDWDSTQVGDVLPMAVQITLVLQSDEPTEPGKDPQTYTVQRTIPLACGKAVDESTLGLQ